MTRISSLRAALERILDNRIGPTRGGSDVGLICWNCQSWVYDNGTGHAGDCATIIAAQALAADDAAATSEPTRDVSEAAKAALADPHIKASSKLIDIVTRVIEIERGREPTRGASARPLSRFALFALLHQPGKSPSVLGDEIWAALEAERATPRDS